MSLLIPVLLHGPDAHTGAAPLLDLPDAISLIPVLSTLVVGTALANHRPAHPVGWLFLLFAVAQIVPGSIDVITEYLLSTRAELSGAMTVLAAPSDMSFVWWLTLLALILLLTPGGCCVAVFIGSRRVPWCSPVGSLPSAQRSVRMRGSSPPLGGQPILAISALHVLTQRLVVTGVIVVHVGVVLAVVAVIRRYRASSPEIRPQLRWLRRAALPLLLLVALAYVAAVLDVNWLLWLSAMGFAAILPIAVGLAIEREHLFDIERLVSRSVSWLLLTATLIGIYVVVVFLSSRALGQRVGDSPPPVILATLAAGWPPPDRRDTGCRTD